MDTFTTLVAVITLVMIWFGEQFKIGAYIWLAILFSMILALRMGAPMFYMAEAGLIAVLVYRTFTKSEDIRSSEDD